MVKMVVLKSWNTLGMSVGYQVVMDLFGVKKVEMGRKSDWEGVYFLIVFGGDLGGFSLNVGSFA